MTESEIKEYRKILEKEFVEKDLEIETSLSYISVGALAFFITINDKFLNLQEANFKFILIVSLAFIFLSFILTLIRKKNAKRMDLRLMKMLDNMSIDKPVDDEKLFNLWKENHGKLSNIMSAVFWCLSIGIGLEILFFALNLK